jgi:YidC/Oxa1 family membrane protein insertase
MVWRYILAFVLSIALLFGWQIYNAARVPNNPPVAQKADPKARPVAPGQPPGQAAQGAIGAAKPAVPASGSEKPGEKAPAVEQKAGGFSAVWKDGLGSLERVLKDDAELTVFGPSGGGLALSVSDGKDGWRRLDFGWKAIEGAADSGWAHELQDTESFKVTRRVAVGVTGDGILRLDVSLEFENNGTGPVRYRLGGGSGADAGFVAASRVRAKGQSRSVESHLWQGTEEEPWRREGEAQWVAMRRGGKLAVLFSKDGGYAAAAIVDTSGTFLEGLPLATGQSKHSYQLAIGSNAPGILDSYGVEGELALINHTEVELVPDRIKVVVDSGRSSISEVFLLDHYTAVEGAADREHQPVLLEPVTGAALLSMGSSIGPGGDAAENWGGQWSESVRALPGGGKEIIFEKRIGSVRIRKKIAPAAVDEFDELLGEGAGALADGHLLRVSVELTNLADVQTPFSFMLYGPCAMSSSASSGRMAGLDIQLAFGTYGRKKGVLAGVHDIDDLPGLVNDREVAWLSTVNAYFTALMFPRTREEGARGIYAEPIPYPSNGWWPISDTGVAEGSQSLRTGFKCTSRLPPGGNPRELVFGLYIGPRVSAFIDAGSALEFDGANDFGLTSALIHFFMGLLNLLQKATLGNWGLAIILLTIIVKICLHPVTRKNQRGMMRMGKAMAKIKPEMEVLQAQCGDDKMKYSQEVQKLWKKHNVNPAKQMLGCLVIFLQMPIWIGIIWSLEYSIGVRQASFLYIEDLTRPDMLFPFPFHVPLLGEYFNLLPVLYVVLTMVNQKMQPRSDDPQAAAQQKMMGFMMIFFGFIFYGFASGFMLYIMTSAALGIAESKIIKAQLAREDLELEGKPGGEDTAASAGPLYKARNKSAEKSIVPSSAKKKKRRKRF